MTHGSAIDKNTVKHIKKGLKKSLKHKIKKNGAMGILGALAELSRKNAEGAIDQDDTSRILADE